MEAILKEAYLVWLLVGAVLLLIEALTPGTFIFFCFGVSGFVTAGLVYFLYLDTVMSLVTFFALSLILLVAIKPAMKKTVTLPNPGEISYSKRVVGGEARVYKEIPRHGVGSVKLFDSGEVWNAKSVDGALIESKTNVRVADSQGTTLLVERAATAT